MKRSLVTFTLTALMAGLAACSSPMARESNDHGQKRFEQQQKRYPDRHSSQQEADAAERLRQAERNGS